MATSNAPTDDFFGSSYVGYNPMTGPTSDYLNNLSAIHTMIQGGSQGQPQGNSWGGGMGFSPSYNSPYGPPSSSTPGPAGNMQVNNPTNTYRTQFPTRGGSGTPVGNVSGIPGPSYDYSNNPNIPPDLRGIRTNVTNLLNSQLTQGPQSYGGSFNLGTPYGAPEAYMYANGAPQSITGQGAQGLTAADNLTNFSANADFSSLMPAVQQLLGGITGNANQAWGLANQGFGQALQYGGQAANTLGSSMPTAMNIAQTGGVNFQALLSGLNNIQNAGQNNLNSSLAQIREQYGAQGLGQGSDVSSALGLGASQGWGNVLAQQSSLMNSVLGAGTQAQLGGLNAVNNIGQGYTGIGNMIGNAGINAAGTFQNIANPLISSLTGGINAGMNVLQQPVQNQLASAGIQLGGINAIPGYLGQYNTAYNNAAQNNLSLAGMNQQANQYSNQMQYQDFTRMAGLSPQLQAALQYSTAFPPMVPQGPSPWAQIGSSALGAAGTIGAAALMFSDRNAKENIEPVSSVLETLKSLPIFRWNYKGDPTPHIGPMAQDFKEKFGVGDGTHIHLVDAMGVLLQSMKEMATA